MTLDDLTPEQISDREREHHTARVEVVRAHADRLLAMMDKTCNSLRRYPPDAKLTEDESRAHLARLRRLASEIKEIIGPSYATFGHPA